MNINTKIKIAVLHLNYLRKQDAGTATLKDRRIYRTKLKQLKGE